MDERINILRKYNLWGDTAFDLKTLGYGRKDKHSKKV